MKLDCRFKACYSLLEKTVGLLTQYFYLHKFNSFCTYRDLLVLLALQDLLDLVVRR